MNPVVFRWLLTGRKKRTLSVFEFLGSKRYPLTTWPRHTYRQRCEHGTASQTPHLDAQLQKPNARAALLSLSAAFAAAAEEGRCLKCAVQSVVPDLKVCMQDMKMAKKNGSFTKEDKKALKAEMKWLFAGIKDVRKSWKTEA